ncbi:MAG: hypothetical protein R3E97_05895 [Candidatus Eisenbacteria bacterium]
MTPEGPNAERAKSEGDGLGRGRNFPVDDGTESESPTKRALVLPDGIRFPERDELTGPRAERERLWARIGRANLRSGFVSRVSTEPEFAVFAEANVDAPALWSVLVTLVRALLPAGVDSCQLLLGDADSELEPIAWDSAAHWLETLEPYAHRLVHDAWVQFGLVDDGGGKVSGVLVTPTKHLQIWAQSREKLVEILKSIGLDELSELELLAGYPVVLEPLDVATEAAPSLEELFAKLRGDEEGPADELDENSFEDAAEDAAEKPAED